MLYNCCVLLIAALQLLDGLLLYISHDLLCAL